MKGGSNSQKFFTAQQTTANAARAKPRPGQCKAKKLGRKTLLHSHSLNLVEAVHFTGFQMNGTWCCRVAFSPPITSISTLGLHRGPYKGMFVKDLDTDLSFISRRRAITTSLDKEQHLCSFVERDLNAMIGQMPLFWLVNVIGGLKATRQHHVRIHFLLPSHYLPIFGRG